MSEKILFVDDEPEILQSFSRQFGRKYAVDCAPGGVEGLDLISRQGPYAIILSDMKMPGLDGIAFLAKAKLIAPDSVRMMLTGVNEQIAAKALNEGHIFRFLSKPCPPEVLEPAIEAALGQYRVIQAERAMLANTLTGAIKILTDVLASVRPVAIGRTNRIRDLVRRLAKDLPPAQLWRAELAALLSQVGSMSIPEDVLAKAYQRKWLSKSEQAPYEQHPLTGQQLVANVPRLEEVAEIILQQNKCFDGTGFPNDGVAGEAIPMEARILKVALDFDSLLQSGVGSTQAFMEMTRCKGAYDRTVLASLVRSMGKEAANRMESLAT